MVDITYTDSEGQEVTLPKLTLRINKLMDAVDKAQGNDDRLKGELAFLKAVLPAAYVKESLGGSNINDVDIVALNVSYLGVTGAYAQPMMDAANAATEARNESLRGMSDALELVDKMYGRRGANVFKKVK